MRTDSQWNKKGTYLIPADDIPVVLKNDYLNFGGLIPGDVGFGIRNNGGTIELKNSGGAWAAPAVGGEANTASNLGLGSSLFSAKVGVDLRFKSLIAGTGISLVSTGNDVTVTATAGGGDALTADPLSQFAATTKLQLNGVISDGTPMYVGDAPTAHTHTKSEITDLNAYEVGGTDVAVADGGTGASTAAGARTALGVDPAGTDNSTPVTVTDSAEIDFTLVGQNITAVLLANSVAIGKLSAGVQTSLGKADTAEQAANKDQVNGYAGLDGSGKINSAQLPALAVSEFLGNFTSTTTALADVGVQASQRGDWFTVDTNGGETWFVTTDSPTTTAHITLAKTPTDGVTSVFGRTGAVTVHNGDYTTDQVTEGTNLYYTDARVSANADVVANTVKVSADGSIDTHSDVTTGTKANNDVLTWNSTSGVWESKAPTGGGGTVATVALGNLGTAKTIDWSLSQTFSGTLDANTTISFSNESDGKSIDIVLSYDGVAQRSITWVGVDEWSNGSEPTAPSSLTKETVVTLLRVGTVTYGFHNTATVLGNGTINLNINNGGSVMTTGVLSSVKMDFAGTITAVRLLSDVAGDIVIDIWKDIFANQPATSADSITALAKPTLSAASSYEDTTLTGWTVAFSAGDMLTFNIDSVATITNCTLILDIAKT